MFTHHDIVTRTVKSLSLSAIEKANSGHTSFPLAMSDIGYHLFYNVMNYHSKQTKWINRDRLVLSSGHGSMFLYSFLHLTGFNISLDDIKGFRHLNSITPGHPEFGITEGVECTTGPLGQGIANAVGMALAEEMLAAEFNTEKEKIFSHLTYCLCGDGDLMEGVAMEAISFAGHLALKKLIVIYDYNRITIDGKIDLTYSEDVEQKFIAQKWNVITIDGHNLNNIESAVAAAQKSDKPTLVIAKTIPGKGASGWEGSHKIHGNPMKAEDYQKSYDALGIDRFTVPSELAEVQKSLLIKQETSYTNWLILFVSWKKNNPELAIKLDATLHPDFTNVEKKLDTINITNNAATRVMSGEVLTQIADSYPALVGGSADLAGSNNTTLNNTKFVQANDFKGRNIHFGIREHAMGAVMNGISYHGVLRPYGGTFLVFSDYMRPAVRLAALSHLPTIYIWTHDSFYVGEDGPTHHPVEHISALRLIPNLRVLRPGSSEEVRETWRLILKEKKHPVALCLTRQNLSHIDHTVFNSAKGLHQGAYILKEASKELKYIVIATGSELSLAVKALSGLKIEENTRIVSMPSMEIFEEQDLVYRQSIIPKHIKKRFAIEAGRSALWWKYVGEDGYVFAKDTFSKSAAYKDLENDFGFTVEHINKTLSNYFV